VLYSRVAGWLSCSVWLACACSRSAPDSEIFGDSSAAPPASQFDAGSRAELGPRPDAGLVARDAAVPARGPAADGGAPHDGSRPQQQPDPSEDGGVADGGSSILGTPSTFKVFDQIPQFGIYGTADPDYVPPAGVLMWSHGTEFVTKLTRAQQAQIGGDLQARVTYHAQCDNYDRLGGVFFLVAPAGKTPSSSDPHTELVRFITPFSDYARGALATYVFPSADVATYAATLADASHDVWIGIGGGSNPYDGDPCSNTNQTAKFKAIGFKYSLEFVSKSALTKASSSTLTALYNVSAKRVPVEGAFLLSGASITGRVTVLVSGHGADSGGHEYRSTKDSVSVNGQSIGSFNTQIDCASYERFSPDGNPGIFRSNTSSNPRNWCPGALVPAHTFAATLNPGSNTVRLEIDAAQVPSGSYYATSISFSAP
jgi:hypothetical protein